MKKFLALLMALTLMLATFAGCTTDGPGSGAAESAAPAETAAPEAQAPAAADDGILIGFASNANDENMNVQMETFRQFCEDWNAAGKTPKVEAMITVADSSVEKQIADVESLIQAGCKAIYLHSVDLEGLKPAVDACNAAGVKVLEARGMEYPGKIVNYIGANEWMMAEMAFDWYKVRMDANPDMKLKMGLIYGLASMTMQLVRVDYLVELLQKEYGEERVQVVETMPCDWDSQKAMECMENWYQKHGNEGMNCVVAAGAQMVMGAAQALVAAGVDNDDWLVTTTDATQDVLYGINQGVCDMTVGIRAEMDGPAAAEVCVGLATGTFTADKFEIGPKILATIDSTNIDEWYKG